MCPACGRHWDPDVEEHIVLERPASSGEQCLTVKRRK
jgi:hypothetical protein